jgi:diguanylate cyclase (GGDEF)-like protein/PAS domain S-box-containing protein
MSVEATSALLKVSQAALRGVAWSDLVHEALEELRHLTFSDVAAFYDASSTDGRLTLYDLARRKDGAEALPDGDPFLARIALEGEGDPFESCVTTGDETRRDVAIAVRTGADTYGALTIGSKRSEFAASDRRLLRELAEVLSIARRAGRRNDAAELLFKRSRAVFDHNPNAKMIVDVTTNRFVDVNHTAIEMYGYTREQFLAMTTSDLRAPEDVEPPGATPDARRRQTATTIDTIHRRADGSRLDAHVTSISIERENDRIYIMNVQDMTERNDALARALQSEAQLAHDALHDRLTGLPNRSLLNERLTAAIAQARETGRMTAVLFIDVDQFKHVNDSMGHATGDVLLKVIAERLRSTTRQSDCIARMGGDEFIAVFGDLAEVDHLSQIVRHLERVTAEPIRVPGGEITVTCSIGVALFPRDGDDAETLIRNADTAMYQAKRDGRATTCFFSAEMQHAADQRLRLEGQLREALEAEAFTLAYQPVYAMNGRLLSCEALIRWPRADGTVTEPKAFIPCADVSGLIVPIGAWVLRSACLQSAAWGRESRAIRVSVNVSAKQLADPHFVWTVQRALYDSGLAPHLLELELTETGITANAERAALVVQELHALGVRIAVDDFGIGYNALAALHSNVVDTLKLDGCFVAGIANSPVDQAIAAAAITAAHRLGAKVVAEAVETAEQRAMLAGLRCDAIQGYLLARPMPAEQFGELLRAGSRARDGVQPAERALRRVV